MATSKNINPIFNLNSEKTVADAMIEQYRETGTHNQIIDKECKETFEHLQGKFVLPEQLNHRLIFCLTWDIDKKLSDEQIRKLEILNKTWKNLVSDLYREGNFQINFETSNEFSLQLAVRIHNIVYNENQPECSYEAQSKDTEYYNEPCNGDNIIKLCLKTEPLSYCIQQQLVSAIEKFSDEKYRPKALSDLNKLFTATEEFIASLNIPKARQKKEKLRLLNFYLLSVIYTDKITTLWDKTANE